MLQVEHIAKHLERDRSWRMSISRSTKGMSLLFRIIRSGENDLSRCLNHLEKADSGRLTLAGKTYDLSKLSKKDILEIRQKTALVFQHYNLFANKTAYKISRRSNWLVSS